MGKQGRKIAILVALVFAVAGCASGNVDGAGDGSLPPAAFSAADSTLSSGGPRDTGTFPNINEEPLPSLNQISDTEKADLERQLIALRAEHDRGRITTAQYRQRLAYLQRLARTHSADTIRDIQAQ